MNGMIDDCIIQSGRNKGGRGGGSRAGSRAARTQPNPRELGFYTAEGRSGSGRGFLRRSLINRQIAQARGDRRLTATRPSARG